MIILTDRNEDRASIEMRYKARKHDRSSELVRIKRVEIPLKTQHA
jgi:hypothetical protein